MNKELIDKLLNDLCDNVLGRIDFESDDERFGGLLTLQYIIDNNTEILKQLNNVIKEQTNEMG